MLTVRKSPSHLCCHLESISATLRLLPDTNCWVLANLTQHPLSEGTGHPHLTSSWDIVRGSAALSFLTLFEARLTDQAGSLAAQRISPQGKLYFSSSLCSLSQMSLTFQPLNEHEQSHFLQSHCTLLCTGETCQSPVRSFLTMSNRDVREGTVFCLLSRNLQSNINYKTKVLNRKPCS